MRLTKKQKDIVRDAENKIACYRDSRDPDIKVLLEAELIVVSLHPDMYENQVMVRAYKKTK